MKYDIVIAGVGGQGIIAVATIIAKAAMLDGFYIRQSEIHGMSQRGGNVSAYVRIGSEPIASDMIPVGTADMILSMEPLESLRYLNLLAKNGVLVTANEPVKNISDYPEVEKIYTEIKSLPNSRMVDINELAKKAGTLKSGNMVLIGAASSYFPIKLESLEKSIHDFFIRKGEAVVATNLKALQIGRLNNYKL
jgi:indolepyruvate ferredoxin oxidoreductase beta subunit